VSWLRSCTCPTCRVRLDTRMIKDLVEGVGSFVSDHTIEMLKAGGSGRRRPGRRSSIKSPSVLSRVASLAAAARPHTISWPAGARTAASLSRGRLRDLVMAGCWDDCTGSPCLPRRGAGPQGLAPRGFAVSMVSFIYKCAHSSEQGGGGCLGGMDGRADGERERGSEVADTELDSRDKRACAQGRVGGVPEGDRRAID
jgi:hypothetical protein